MAALYSITSIMQKGCGLTQSGRGRKTFTRTCISSLPPSLSSYTYVLLKEVDTMEYKGLACDTKVNIGQAQSKQI